MAVAKTRIGSNIIAICCAGPRRKPVLPDIQNKTSLPLIN
jgi:aspartate/glutamate racemase